MSSKIEVAGVRRPYDSATAAAAVADVLWQIASVTRKKLNESDTMKVTT
jgi:hypothetical protein